MSAPPDAPNQPKMSGHNHQEPSHQPHAETHSNVRHIPIFVEGRDEPVINKSVDHGTHFGDAKPQYAPPPQQPHVDRDQYFADDGPTNFHPPPNFSRAFGTPFNNKTYRQGPQPFVQQKAYPQTAFARGPSPQRGQSPKPTEDYVKVPVHHDTPKAEPPSRAQQPPPPPPRSPQQQAAPPHSPQREQTPPRPQEPSSNDPISLILSIQTDVLNLMTDVENFTGTKKDKTYLYLDEMLTRNLIKLDNIETDGKENIRQARKEAIRCIQKCIAVLEAKADSSNQKRNPQLEGETQPESQTGDVDMKENSQNEQATENVADPVVQNGEVEMKESTKEDKPVEHQTPAPAQTNVENKTESTATEEKKDEQKPEEVKPETQEPQPDDIKAETNATTQPSADTRPEDKTEEKKAPKKVTKIVKKRDKSKDKKDAPKDSNKDDKTNSELKTEPMSVDGDKTDAAMEIDGAASQ